MPAQPNLSLGRGFAVLGALCAAGIPVGSRELARRLGDEATRVNRMLGTLRDLGLVEQDAQRRYRPGPGVHILAAQCLRGSGLLAAALPELQALIRPDRGVALGVLWQGQVSYLVHASPGRPLVEGISGHAIFASDQSSIGMVLEACGGVAAPRNPPGLLAAIRRRGWSELPGAQGGSLAVAIPGEGAGAPPVAGLAAIVGDLGPAAAHARDLAVAARRIADRLRQAG
jgi:hypothetical protein